jgi:hypothetical protein
MSSVEVIEHDGDEEDDGNQGQQVLRQGQAVTGQEQQQQVTDTGSDLPAVRQQQVSSSPSSNQNNSNVLANNEQGTQSNVTVNNNRSESNINGRNDENTIEIAAFYNAMFEGQRGSMNNMIRQFMQGNS